MWVENELRILGELKRTCLVHMILQSKSAYLNHTIHNIITIPNIFLGAVTGISIFSTSNEAWRVTAGAMAICSTVLTGLSRQLGPGERAQLHASVTKQYHSIVRDINMKQLMDIVVYEEKQRFIEHTKNEIDRLLSLQPEPSMWVVRCFEKKYKALIDGSFYPDFDEAEEELMQKAETVSNRVSTHTNKKASSSYYSLRDTANMSTPNMEHV